MTVTNTKTARMITNADFLIVCCARVLRWESDDEVELLLLFSTTFISSSEAFALYQLSPLAALFVDSELRCSCCACAYVSFNWSLKKEKVVPLEIWTIIIIVAKRCKEEIKGKERGKGKQSTVSPRFFRASQSHWSANFGHVLSNLIMWSKHTGNISAYLWYLNPHPLTRFLRSLLAFSTSFIFFSCFSSSSSSASLSVQVIDSEASWIYFEGRKENKLWRCVAPLEPPVRTRRSPFVLETTSYSCSDVQKMFYALVESHDETRDKSHSCSFLQ